MPVGRAHPPMALFGCQPKHRWNWTSRIGAIWTALATPGRRLRPSDGGPAAKQSGPNRLKVVHSAPRVWRMPRPHWLSRDGSTLTHPLGSSVPRLVQRRDNRVSPGDFAGGSGPRYPRQGALLQGALPPATPAKGAWATIHAWALWNPSQATVGARPGWVHRAGPQVVVWLAAARPRFALRRASSRG